MNNGRIAGRMSTLHISSAGGKGLTQAALPLAILVALTVNVYPRWSPNYPPPIGLLCRPALFTAFPLVRTDILRVRPRVLDAWAPSPSRRRREADRLMHAPPRQNTDCRAEALWPSVCDSPGTG